MCASARPTSHSVTRIFLRRRAARVLACAIASVPAFAEAAPPTPGKPGDPIVVDVAAEAASVQLPGVEARLVAVVSPVNGVFTVKGPAYASNAITGLSATLINDYCAEKNAKDDFGVSVELRRQSGYTDLLSLPEFGSPRHGPQTVCGSGARTAGDDLDSATTYFALLKLTLCAASQSGRFDLATTVVYGPPFDETLDIRVDAANAPARFMGMTVTPSVLRLPATGPEKASPARERPAVMLLFDPPRALPGFEVQAIRTDDTVVRAYDRPGLSGPPRDGKAQWTFGWPDPISKSSITKFVFRGYRVQPIVWKNVALPPGVTPTRG